MKLYAPPGWLRNLQVAIDCGVLAWIGCWVWIGFVIHDAISALARPGDFLVNASGGVARNADRLPSVLGPVEGALDSLANGLQNAGDSQIEAANDLALFVAIFVVVWPVLPVLIAHVVRRLAWMRTAGAIAKLMPTGKNFEELLAQRALVNRPLHELAAVSDDPVGDVRSGNYAALARLEAKRYGIRERSHR